MSNVRKMLWKMLCMCVAMSALLVTGAPAFARKPRNPACGPGRFITSTSPLVASQVDVAGFFSLTITPSSPGHATLVIPGCAPVNAKLSAAGKGVLNLMAKWASCTGLGGKVQLMASVRGCNLVKGTLSQKKGRPHRKQFTARLSVCGDGILDSGDGELCDGNQGCGNHCTNTCTCAQGAGGSGAFGIITVNGKQKMYLPQPFPNPAGHGVVSVVNVGVAGNGITGAPALITNIDLGTSDSATATGGDSGAVIAASTRNQTIWFIDPRADQVVKTLTLDSSYGTSSFSGGGGYVTGIAIDSLNRRAILSVWNGFILIDLRTMSITGSIPAPPAENFGFDGIAERIIAPFYDCTSASGGTGTPPPCSLPQVPGGGTMTDGVLVIDLKNNNTTYTFQDASATDPTQPAGSEPDGAAADSGNGLIVINDESTSNHVIDLSQAMFANGSVTAPQKVLTPSQRLTGVAVEPTAHVAFFEGEFADNVGFLQITSLASVATAITEATMPSLPDGSGFSNLGDPHGIAVTTGILNGGPVGFVVDSGFRWVARVDLAKALMLPAPGNQISGMDIATVVTYLDAQTLAP